MLLIASNVRGVADYLNKQAYGYFLVHFGCACHVINLIVQKLLGKTMAEGVALEIEENENFTYNSENSSTITKFQNLVKKCREIASVFHKSTQLNELLKEKQKELNLPKNGLVQEVSTRWNSLFLMILIIFEQSSVRILYYHGQKIYIIIKIIKK